MDSLQSLLALLVLSCPLLAAAGIAASGLRGKRRPGRQLAMVGAAASFCAAAAALVRLSSGRLGAAGSLGLGTWLSVGPHDPLGIAFGMTMDIPTAGLAAVIALCTLCALAWNRSGPADGPSERLLYIAASFLLSSSLGIVMSSNVGELFVFWQIAAVSAYLMSSAAADTVPRAGAARKFILTQRIAEFCLLLAVFAIAIGYQTLDLGELLDHLLAREAAQRFALVHFVGLCLLGACVARCALIPLLAWTEGLAAGPALVSVMVEGICLMPAGALLLIRCLPVLHAAVAAAALAVFLGGASAFCAAVCAWAETDARRQAGFACASVLGIVVLGLSLPVPTAGVFALVLTATFLPTSAAVLGWFATGPAADGPSRGVTGESTRLVPRTAPRFAQLAVAVSIALLFSGICGQGGILAAGLNAVVVNGDNASATLVLALGLALGAQFFAAFAITRALLAGRTAYDASVPASSSVFETNPFEVTPETSTWSSSWSMIVLAGCGIAIGLVAGGLATLPRTGAGTSSAAVVSGSVVGSIVGCLPALLGFLAGWWRPRREPADRPSPQAGGLLLRLGRNRFYCDAFLFVFVVLSVRGLAQLARFVDWFFIDGFVSGAPASAVESAAVLLEPVQRRSVSFYLASAGVGTALLAVVVVWLRG
jgi:NADH-quinone oxidoreductase subunit L